jgi:hypothetical protein
MMIKANRAAEFNAVHSLKTALTMVNCKSSLRERLSANKNERPILLSAQYSSRPDLTLRWSKRTKKCWGCTITTMGPVGFRRYATPVRRIAPCTSAVTVARIAVECEIPLYQCAPITCIPLKPLPLYQASKNAINAKPRPNPAVAARAKRSRW